MNLYPQKGNEGPALYGTSDLFQKSSSSPWRAEKEGARAESSYRGQANWEKKGHSRTESILMLRKLTVPTWNLGDVLASETSLGGGHGGIKARQTRKMSSGPQRISELFAEGALERSLSREDGN